MDGHRASALAGSEAPNARRCTTMTPTLLSSKATKNGGITSMQPSGVSQMRLGEDHVFAGVAARWSGCWVEARPTRDSLLHGQIVIHPAAFTPLPDALKQVQVPPLATERARPARSSFKPTTARLVLCAAVLIPNPMPSHQHASASHHPGRPRGSTPHGGFLPFEHESQSCR